MAECFNPPPTTQNYDIHAEIWGCMGRAALQYALLLLTCALRRLAASCLKEEELAAGFGRGAHRRSLRPIAWHVEVFAALKIFFA